MAESYKQMRARHQEEINKFPSFAAFSEKQFKEGMEKFGLDPDNDKDKVLNVVGGLYIRASDAEKFSGMLANHRKELADAIRANKDKFVFNMFVCELENHEYSYTEDPEETLDACGITDAQLERSEILRKELTAAEKAVMRNAF